MQLISNSHLSKAKFHINLKATLMFKHPRTVRISVLSLCLALLPSTPWKKKKRASPLIHSSAWSIHKVIAGSFSPSILSSSVFSSFSCPLLRLFLSFSRWWNGNAARMDNGTPSLCSPSVSHAHFPSTSVCWRDEHAVCPPLLSSRSGWVMLPPIFSLTVSLLFLSFSLSDTHACAAVCALPTFFSPMLPPSCFLPHLLSAASHLTEYMCMHCEMLHSCTLMHTLQGEMGMWKKEGIEERVDVCVCGGEGVRGCGVYACVCVRLGFMMFVGHDSSFIHVW